jgi:O-antigen ligase
VLGLSFLVVFFATALDFWNYLDKGGWPRYLLLLVPLSGFALIRLRSPTALIRRPTSADRVLMALLLFGLTGAIVGVVVEGTSATTLPIFLPMIVAFLYLGCLETPTEREARLLLRGLEWVGILYAGLAAAVALGLIPGFLEFRQFRNASLAFVALGVAAAISQRHWLRFVLVAGLGVLVFVVYPSGTSIVVGLTVAFTLLMVPLRVSRIRPYLLGSAAAAAVILVLLNFNAWVQLSNDYFSLVGKSNNNSTRLAVWTAGLERFQESPIYGDGFSGPTVTTAIREEGRQEFQLPYHNDYIQVLANGGLIGLGLLVGWIVLTELLVFRRYLELVDAGEWYKGATLRTLLSGFNAFVVIAAFNPTISGVSRATSLFCIYGLMMLLHVRRQDVPP